MNEVKVLEGNVSTEVVANPGSPAREAKTLRVRAGSGAGGPILANTCVPLAALLRESASRVMERTLQVAIGASSASVLAPCSKR